MVDHARGDGPQPHAEGIVILDRAGAILHAAGIGSDERVRAIVADPERLRELREHRLIALNLDGRRLAIVAMPFDGGLITILSEVPDSVFDFIGAVDFAYDIIHHMIRDPFDAMTVVDAEARVAFISPVHESFLGLERGEAIGMPVRNVIENTRLDRVVRTGKAEVGQLQRMRGAERIVSRVPIQRDARTLGAIGRVMFRGPEKLDALNRRLHDLEREVEFYRREAKALRRQDYGTEAIIGESQAIQRLKSEIIKVAPLDVSVLIRGESGTGKDLIAKALHNLSPRKENKLITVNAAALPASLVESELFGYEPGAFTGADRKGRRGKFELAAGGSIFLDEIGDMPLDVQAKLLRVLQDHVVERVGGNQGHEVDFRLISATNRNLQSLVRSDRFRLDLYYRISPVVLEVPPLRERLEDIPLLVAYFLREYCERHRRPVPELSGDLLDHLASMPWPGNVRQLRHEVERAVIFSESSTLSPADFLRYDDVLHSPDLVPLASRATHPGETLQAAVERIEEELIRDAMRRHAGNKKRTAEELGISRSYLYKRLGAVEA